MVWMKALRKLLGNTWVADVYRKRRDLKEARSWNAEDDRRRAFYAQFVKEDDLVFDIGANLGNRTRVFLKLGATVVALEPQPYCQALLTRVFGGQKKMILVPCAAGEQEGTAKMAVARSHFLSSLSTEWLAEVKKSNRFNAVNWDKTIDCKVTTVKQLMATYGVPSFIKIDVEGFELQVIKGMDCSVKNLSFEFTPECLAAAYACIDSLNALGMVEFNYSDGESMEINLSWQKRDEIKKLLRDIPKTTFGDIYARMPSDFSAMN